MFEKMLVGFSPRLGLKTLCKLMPDRVGHPVEKYEMRFFAGENRIDFLIYMPAAHFNALEPRDVKTQSLFLKYNNEKKAHLYKFEDGEKICKIALKLIEPKLPKDYTLQYVIVNYDDSSDHVTADAYGTRNNEKEKHTITL
jgi:hypothetical protein